MKTLISMIIKGVLSTLLVTVSDSSDDDHIESLRFFDIEFKLLAYLRDMIEMLKLMSKTTCIELVPK